MGQSTISTHLSQLKQAGLVEDRRTGKNSLYRLTTGNGNDVLADLLVRAQREIPEADARPRHASTRRQKTPGQDARFFDSVAGRLGKDYVPGKSWKSVAEALLRLMPPMVIADLGAGDGSFSLLLAQSRIPRHRRGFLCKDDRVRARAGPAAWRQERGLSSRRHGRDSHRRRCRRHRFLLAIAASCPAS